MTESYVYDLCVVGAGLFGSAAAQHASELGSVCLVGPEEPKVKSLDDERDIYGAHYDEGRIARSLDRDPVWSTLSQKSIARYRELERKSGILFYDEVGAIVSGERNSEDMTQFDNVIKTQHLKVEHLTYQQFKDRFTYLNISDNDYAFYTSYNAGYISPRKLITAQIKQAKSNGCVHVTEVVNNVTKISKEGKEVMLVSTSTRNILAKKVLLATGAFTAFRKLLPSGMELDVKLNPITVAKVEISESDVRKIKTMPTMVYFGNGAPDWTKAFPRSINGPIHWYMLPPIKYPDGKHYIKLGHYDNISKLCFTSGKAVKDWFCSGGDKKIINATAQLITNVVKGVKPLSYHGDCCVITETVTGRPYIDTIHSQLGVVVGGNGLGAKTSDEIGRIAAVLMMKGRWDSPLPKELFEVKMKAPDSKI